MSQQRNPRYFASSWYTSKFATDPWPAGWYWHDYAYTWYGPHDSEAEAAQALNAYVESRATETSTG